MKLQKVSVQALAKPLAVAMGTVGLIAGVVYSFGGLVSDLYTTGLNTGTLLAFLALIGMPIIFATLGFTFGVVAAFLNNLVVSLTSGKS